jgi:hypothetical protein
MLHENVVIVGSQRDSHNHAIFLLEELIIHLKECGSETNFSSSVMASTCKTDCSASVLSLRSLFLMTNRAWSIGTLVKRLKTSKLTRVFGL